MGIRPDGVGNITNSHVIYHEKQGAYVPSPIAHEGLVYMVTDEGQGWCIEAKTGRRLWSQRLGQHHRPSPVYADGHVYFLADNGEMFVLKAGRKFELVGRNSIGEECYASPAISNGRLYIRTTGNIYCIAP
jgi:hypothetical protein